MRVLALCVSALVLSVTSYGKNLQGDAKPRLRDWEDATWFDDMVKIPLLIYESSMWYANLIAGGDDTKDHDTVQNGGRCMLDNNSAQTLIYTDHATGSDWYDVSVGAAECGTSLQETLEDGSRFSGYPCTQRLCIGSWVFQEDVHTTVCNLNNPFFYATTRLSSDWTWRLVYDGYINSICGLGKEAASSRSNSFVSLAVQNGDLAKNMYSFAIEPHFAGLSASNHRNKLRSEINPEEPEEGEHKIHLQKLPFQFQVEAQSTLTLGGSDPADYSGNITWYDTSGCPGGWNLTATALTVGDVDMMPTVPEPTPPEPTPPEPSATVESAVVSFQMAFPYIGLPQSSFDAYKELLSTTWNPTITGNFNCPNCDGVSTVNCFCYWGNKQCSDIYAPDDLAITIGDKIYNIPVRQLMVDTNSSSGYSYCDLYITRLADADTEAIVLGDPFFSAFYSIFDVENDQLGLAMSTRALDGVLIETVEPTPDPPVPTQFAQ